MKFSVTRFIGHQRQGGRGGAFGFTLPEVTIAMAIFTAVVAAMVSTQYVVMRMDQLVGSKLGATDMSRLSFTDLTRDIRAAKIWAIGTGDETGFAPIPNGSNQQGNALQMSFSADTNTYVRYYFRPADSVLCRLQSGIRGSQVLARYLTNTMSFQAETYDGHAVTDLQYKYVIHVVMDFCQFQYPLTRVGPGFYYNSYRIEFRMSPHCPDGA